MGRIIAQKNIPQARAWPHEPAVKARQLLLSRDFRVDRI
jgi:hypothetical protein